MEDVDDVRELVEERMGETGFEEDILERVMDLLDTFDTDRTELLEEMLARLEQPGYDGLSDRWATNCEQAEALLDRFEEDMRSILEESEANALSPDERMAAVGPVDFLTGERKIWAEVGRLVVPEAAELMSRVLETDLAIIKKCEEDLKNAQSNDAIVQEILRQNFGTVMDKAKSLLAKYAQPTAFARLLVFFMRDPAAKAAATEAIEAWERAAEEIYNAALQKKAAKKTVLDNIKLLDDARERLDVEWIMKVFARGAEAAGGWRGIGQTGDYRAADWDWVKDNAINRGLDTRAEGAKEQSEKLYDELYPTFIEQSTNALAQLTDDPAVLQKFTDDLTSTFKSMDEVFENESAYAATLTDGAYKQAAQATLDQVKTALKASREQLLTRTKEADDEVKE